MFVWKHPNLRVRLVQGNTLTTTVIINEIYPYFKEVFLTGATSKLGRSISLYLCRKRVRVLVCSINIIVLLHSVWLWLKMGVLIMCRLSALIILKILLNFAHRRDFVVL